VTGLLRYHAALLIRSYRWVAAALVFAVVVASATAGGSSAADAFGFAGAVLVPACAWLVRVVATVEPGAARASWGGWGRGAQLSALLVVAGVGLALSASVPVVLDGGRRVTDRPQPPTGLAWWPACSGKGEKTAPAPAMLRICGGRAAGLLVVVAWCPRLGVAAIRAGIGGGASSRLLVELACAALVAAVAVACPRPARSRGVD
jgi:hypothetical protein